MFFGGEVVPNEVCNRFFASYEPFQNAGLAFTGMRSPPLSAIRSQIEEAYGKNAIAADVARLTTFFITAPSIEKTGTPFPAEGCMVEGDFLLDVSRGDRDNMMRLRGTVVSCDTQEVILAALAKCGISMPAGWRSMDVTHLFVAKPAAQPSARASGAKSASRASASKSASRPAASVAPPAQEMEGGFSLPWGLGDFIRPPSAKKAATKKPASAKKPAPAKKPAAPAKKAAPAKAKKPAAKKPAAKK